MKIYDKLDEILKNGSKIKILRFLFTEGDEHTGRGIARGISMSVSSTYSTLQRMKDEGLLSVRKKGNAILYKLQKNNYIVKKLLEPLFEKEKSISNDIVSFIARNLFREKKEIISIAIFGSVARKEERSRSDIDLVVIAKSKIGKSKVDKAMDKLSIDVAKKFGASISPYILTEAEIKRKYNEKQPIIHSILNSNQLIYGEPIERILA